MAASPEERWQRRHRRQVYLSEADLNAVLNDSFFTEPMTVNRLAYRFYRGRSKVTVLTVRFNLIPSFNKQAMVRNLMHVLDTHFNLQDRIVGSVRYDLVLRNSHAEPTTFYIWRAKTNQSEFDENAEISVAYTHANIYRFCQDATNIHIPDLNIFFSESSVVIDRCIAIVFSFVS